MSTEAVQGQPEPHIEAPEHARPVSDGQSLADLKRGQRVTISAVDATSPEVQRLMTLGLVEGAVIELAGKALGGDPLEFRLFGRGVSLRKEQARCFSCAPAGVRD